MNVYKPLFLNAFCCLLLAGCVSLPPQPAPLNGFILKGKLAVEDAGERHSASFQWRQDGEEYGIDVWGPLGQGRIHLQGNRNRLMLIDGNGDVVRQGRPETVMQAALGWSMPLQVLPAWVLGQPDAGLPARALVYGEQGHLESFTQAGWSVQFAQYREVQPAPDARWLPRRIDARNPATKIRLVIAEWQI